MTYKFEPERVMQMQGIKLIEPGRYLISLKAKNGETRDVMGYIKQEPQAGSEATEYVAFDEPFFSIEMMNGHINAREVVGAVMDFHKKILKNQ